MWRGTNRIGHWDGRNGRLQMEIERAQTLGKTSRVSPELQACDDRARLPNIEPESAEEYDDQRRRRRASRSGDDLAESGKLANSRDSASRSLEG
jgi:hypothetical protein